MKDHTRLGPKVPEVEVDHIREIVREGYRIIYLESDKR